MMISVLFFAELRELLNCSNINVDWAPLAEKYAQPTLENLLEHLCEIQPEWAEILKAKSWLAAQNQAMTDRHQPIKAGDEIAFFPPVTGG